MLRRFRLWRQSGVRGVGPGMKQPTGWYVKWTPNFGISIPWFRGRRLRVAWHHGIQRICWRDASERWVVEKQLLGRSRVVGEIHVNPTPERAPDPPLFFREG